MEEAGESARAVRAYEIGRDRPDEKESSRAEQKQELIEEMGDVIGNIAILADMYGVRRRHEGPPRKTDKTI